MPAEQVPGPGESGCSRFMTRTKEGRALGHGLLITHGFAIFFSGLEQDGEEVTALCRVSAPLINEALNTAAHDMDGFVHAQIAWQRPTGWRQERREGMRHVLVDDGHSCAEFVGFGEDVGVKERFADDAHREVGHVPIDIDDGPIGPTLLDVLAILSHDVGIASNMAWLERWGHQLALVTVEIALAAEDAIPNHGTKDMVDGQAFVEVVGMFDQDALDVLWFVEEDSGKWPKMHAADVVFARHTL